VAHLVEMAGGRKIHSVALCDDAATLAPYLCEARAMIGRLTGTSLDAGPDGETIASASVFQKSMF
jgi:hypothetical protein